jgi:predicted metal-dependent HD superfamily phosphohydrolase
MDPQAAQAYILDRLKKELPGERTYHSLGHTLDVYASVIEIAEREGVHGEDLVLLKVAALYHDAGFVEQGIHHEEVGCVLVRSVLPGFGFGQGQTERICAMIMSTRIPQAPRDKLARILCDADLDYLGRNDFQMIGNMLFAEMVAYGVLKTEREWNELQVRFLERHRYFTRTNRELREPVKQQNLAVVRAWLEAHPE